MVSLRGEIILLNFQAPPKKAVISLTSKQSNASLKAKVGTEFEM